MATNRQAEPLPQMQLRISVPQAVDAGQQVVFTTPDGQRMQVVMEQTLPAGSSFLVQYVPSDASSSNLAEAVQPTTPAAVPTAPSSANAPAAARPGALPPSLPETAPAPAVTSTTMLNGVIVRPAIVQGAEGPLLPEATASLEAADQQASNFAWALYASGWAVLCCGCALLTPILWCIACSQYYWKDRRSRAQYPRHRIPAKVSLVTCLIFTVAGLILATVCVAIYLQRTHVCHHWHHHHCHGHVATFQKFLCHGHSHGPPPMPRPFETGYQGSGGDDEDDDKACIGGEQPDGKYKLCIGDSDCRHPNNFCGAGDCHKYTGVCEAYVDHGDDEPDDDIDGQDDGEAAEDAEEEYDDHAFHRVWAEGKGKGIGKMGGEDRLARMCEVFEKTKVCHDTCDRRDLDCHKKCPLPECPKVAAFVKAIVACREKCRSGNVKCDEKCEAPVRMMEAQCAAHRGKSLRQESVVV